MDSLKPYLAAMNRNRFWILSAIVILTALIVWYSAESAVAQKYALDKGTNDRAFSSLGMFRRTEVNKLPNAEFKVAVDKRRVTLEGQVIEAWQKLFSNQKSVLPVNQRVGEMEKYLVNEEFYQAPIPVKLRELYRDNGVVEDDFQKLFALLNLRRYEGQNLVDLPPKSDEVSKLSPVGLVVWNAVPGPRELMLRYKTELPPTSVRVRLTQEDLWVFRSLFLAIQQINSKPIDVWLQILDGQAPDDAPVDQANVPIKQIEYCDLAQYAMSAAQGRPGNVEIIDPAADKVPGGPAALLQAAAGKPQSAFSAGSKGTDAEDQKLVEGRYIDGRNRPVVDPNSPPFSEFKQMFVQMEFIMDQRLIPVLITQCANAPIIIETRQVLVDLTEVDKQRTVSAGEAARTLNKIEQSPHDARVTLRGVVYGYSPPKKEHLGAGTDPEPSNRDYGVPAKQKTE